MFKHKKWLIAAALLSVFNSSVNANPDLMRKAKPLYQMQASPLSKASNGLTPTQVKLAYGFNVLPFKGEGQTIGVVVAFDNPNAEADFAVFNTNFSLPACTTANGCFKKIAASGTLPAPDTNWAVESSLEIQWAHAVAPNATILLVEAADDSLSSLLSAVSIAVQQGATVISIGWGTPEFAGETALDSHFVNSAVIFVAASGSTGNGTLYPSVSPNVTAVGGTTLLTDSNGNYLSELAWSGSGGGLSTYETQPSYQANFPLPNNPNALRGVPDVAYNADNGIGFAVYDSYNKAGWIVVGGSGAGAAQWAALAAIIKSGTHKPITNFNNALYLVAKNNYAVTFNQITTGTNGTCGYYCTAQAGYNYVTGLGTPQAQWLAYEVMINS